MCQILAMCLSLTNIWFPQPLNRGKIGGPSKGKKKAEQSIQSMPLNLSPGLFKGFTFRWPISFLVLRDGAKQENPPLGLKACHVITHLFSAIYQSPGFFLLHFTIHWNKVVCVWPLKALEDEIKVSIDQWKSWRV